MLVLPSQEIHSERSIPLGGEITRRFIRNRFTPELSFFKARLAFNVDQFPISQPQEGENCLRLPRVHDEFAYPVWEGPPYLLNPTAPKPVVLKDAQK